MKVNDICRIKHTMDEVRIIEILDEYVIVEYTDNTTKAVANKNLMLPLSIENEYIRSIVDDEVFLPKLLNVKNLMVRFFNSSFDKMLLNFSLVLVIILILSIIFK